VVVIGYAGRAFGLWWEKNAAELARSGNLDVLELPAATADALASLLGRSMRLQCLIQDGDIVLSADHGSVELRVGTLQAGAG
jgi:uncharacterized protein YaeQ